MRVAIDAHALGTGAGGNESYIRALLEALSLQQTDLHPVALTPPGWKGALPPGVASQSLRTRRAALRVALDVPAVLRRERYDLFHAQYVAPPFLPCPALVSIHDFVWKRFPETLPPLTRYRLQALTPRTLKRAQRVFVLSEAMRRELAEFYAFPENRIDVVPPAVDSKFTTVIAAQSMDEVRAKYQLPGDYLLYTGALQPRKNLERLLEAFAGIRAEGLPHRLVIAGKKAWMTGFIADAVERLKLNDALVFTGYVDDADLPALYHGAAAFAYVSIYEGFGIPVVEAMASGTPVLTSNTGALAEVAADAALTCDPFDTDAIADGLRRILTDDATRQRLHQAGPLRAQAFSHQAMGKAAMAGYWKALQETAS